MAMGDIRWYMGLVCGRRRLKRTHAAPPHQRPLRETECDGLATVLGVDVDLRLRPDGSQGAESAGGSVP